MPESPKLTTPTSGELADGTAEADPWLDSDEFAGWVKKNNDKVLDDLD